MVSATRMATRRRHGEWLVILDNVDEAHIVLDRPAREKDNRLQGRRIDFFPACNHGTVLVTSRYRDVATKIVQGKAIIPVGPMDEKHAMSLMTTKLETKHDQTDIFNCVRELGYMPLALTQAAAYINRRAPRCTVSEYRARLDDESIIPKSMLEEEDDDDIARDPEARNSVVRTLRISLAHISRIINKLPDCYR